MASFSGGGQQQPLNAVVADIGRFSTKIGWAGDDQPKSHFRSNVAVLRDESGSVETSSSSHPKPRKKTRHPITDVRYDFYSRPILGYNNNTNNSDGASSSSSSSLDGSWEVSNPVDPVTGLWYQPSGSSLQESSLPADGSGADWADLIPLFLRHGYRTGLNVRSDSWDYPLLLCERSFNPPPLRQQLLEILMEKVQVPSVFFARDAVMQCYACGRTQGTVVDIGYSGTTVTPVYEGFAEQDGIQRAPIGLGAIDLRVLDQMDQLYIKQHSSASGFVPLYQVKQQRNLGWKTMKRRSSEFHQAAKLFLAHECRLSGAGIAVDTTATSSSTNTTQAAVSFQAPNKSFSLPDGTEIFLTSQFRFQSANILLGRPQIVAATATPTEGGAPAPPMAVPTMSSDQEVRHALYLKNREDWTVFMQQQQQQRLQDDFQQAPLGDGGNMENGDYDFSDAAAVGIAKRRTKRLKGEGDPNAPAAADRYKKSSFSNVRLNAACSKYFQTIVDQSLTSNPVAQMICEAAYKCDRDQQSALLGNVILGGGGACLGPTEQAVPDLIKEQTESLIHTHTPGWRVKVLAPSFAERSVLTWLGGSILASLGSFHEMYVTKADYEEWGSAIVNRKCP